MFDIGFSEIVVVGVVALVVIGPEKLPKVARTLGHMFGRLQRYVGEVKADITREIELDELRKLQTEVKDAARDFEQSVTSVASDFKSTVRDVETQLNTVASDVTASASPAAGPAVTHDPAANAAGGYTIAGNGAGVGSASGGTTSQAPADTMAGVPGHAGAFSQTASLPPLEEPPVETSASTPNPAEPPRQPTLPGIDRI